MGEATRLRSAPVAVPIVERRSGPRIVHVEGLLPNEYRFVNRWRLPGTVEEVADIIQHPSEFRRWWPAAWLDFELLDEGDAAGIGRRFRYRVKGWLPYSLRLTFKIEEHDPPHTFVVSSTGDLVGTGRWTLKQDGPKVDVAYDWRVRGDRWFIRRFSGLLKPLFRSNHFWVMRQGAQSMFIELQRRRATTPEELARIPPPPGPIPPTWL